jgi:hypothetical protein
MSFWNSKNKGHILWSKGRMTIITLGISPESGNLKHYRPLMNTSVDNKNKRCPVWGQFISISDENWL